ncbi:MAG: hypothetical protein LBL62_04060 [Planctomycetaceae bacterium]|nr:hypothetical protein [Planctomycetaceae bacterium]
MGYLSKKFAEGLRRLSHNFAALIWFTVGYRRRDLSAKGRPPKVKGCPTDVDHNF